MGIESDFDITGKLVACPFDHMYHLPKHHFLCKIPECDIIFKILSSFYIYKKIVCLINNLSLFQKLLNILGYLLHNNYKD